MVNNHPEFNQDEALQQLKEIILEKDRKRMSFIEEELTRLQSQLQDNESLIETIDPVIARLLHRKIIDSKSEMAEALAPVMGPAIKRQIDNAREDVIDALYPVIGQTIRKSVSEAMKNLARSVNEKLDRALSLKMLHKRIKARLSGIPTEELLLKEALPFLIEEIFFIHKNTGILLSHQSRVADRKNGNEDIISSMLSAIRDFSNTAFSSDEERDLNAIQYDDLQIHLEIGRHAYVAVVTSGVCPPDFNEQLKNLEVALSQQFPLELRDFDGDTQPFDHSATAITKLIKTYNILPQPSAQSTGNPKGWLYLIGIIAISCLIYFIFIYEAPLNSSNASKDEALKTDLKIDRPLLLDQIKQQYGSILSSNLENIQFHTDGDILTIEGAVSNEKERLLLGKTIGQLSGFPILVNNLKSRTDLNSIKNAIEEASIFFDLGSSEISDQQTFKLDELENQLKKIPFNKLFIVGHSDKSGTEQTNHIVALERARKVRDLLISRGIIAEKLVALSAAATQATDAPGSNTEDFNRKVSFSFQSSARD